MKLLNYLICTAALSGAAAAVVAQPAGMPPVSAEMKAAFEACQAKGKPGDKAFDDCMTSKGFKKPADAPTPPKQ